MNLNMSLKCLFHFACLQCSAQCGSGVQTRKVFCGSFEEDNIKKVEDDKCDAEEKYNDTKDCAAKDECTGEWFSGPWSGVSDEHSIVVVGNSFFHVVELNNATVDYTAKTGCLETKNTVALEGEFWEIREKPDCRS